MRGEVTRGQHEWCGNRRVYTLCWLHGGEEEEEEKKCEVGPGGCLYGWAVTIKSTINARTVLSAS